MKVYVAGSLRQPERVIEVTNQITAAGFEVFSDWCGAGPEADDYWQRYEKARGRTYREALASPAAQNTFAFDKRNIEASDAFVLVYPAGKSAHLELGVAIGSGKPGFVLMDEPGVDDRWDVMLNYANAVVYTMDELLVELRIVDTLAVSTLPSHCPYCESACCNDIVHLRGRL